MRVQVRGAYTMKGTAKKSGNDYDMCKLVVDKPQETVSNPNMKRVGIGMDQQEFDMTHAAFERFKALGLGFSQFPIQCDLVVGSKIGFRGLESVIEEVRPVPVKDAA